MELNDSSITIDEIQLESFAEWQPNVQKQEEMLKALINDQKTNESLEWRTEQSNMIRTLAITLNKLYISPTQKNVLMIPINLYHADEAPCSATALIDSGTSESFMDYRVTE